MTTLFPPGTPLLFPNAKPGYNIPVVVQRVRSTIGNNKAVEPTCCKICGEKVLASTREYVCIASVMQGDFEGTPIDSSAIRAMFCWDCFEASADSKLISFFEKHFTFSGVLLSSCLYCNQNVVANDEYMELVKFYEISFIFKSGGRNLCTVDEKCYKEHIDV